MMARTLSSLSAASKAQLGHALDYSEVDLQRIMSPAHFVAVRTTYGGPAPKETGRAIGESRRKLEADGEPRLLHTKRGAGYVLKS